MMLYRVAAVFTILFMAVFGSASAIVARTEPDPPLPECAANTGPIQCCESVQNNLSGSLLNLLLGILPIGVPIALPIGITCSPVLSVLQGTQCEGQTVCCSNNNFNGVVNLGCSPISIL
ncbi:hypothetical protein H1R20_g107, partial [Candolleomyces eurysporus]